MTRFIAVIFFMVALPLAFGPVDAQVVRIGYYRTFTVPALLAGKAQGIFDAKGLQMKWVEIPTPPQIIEAMAAGSLDVGLEEAYLIARERGAKVVAVAIGTGPARPESSYWVAKGSGITRIEDLKGKTCGVNNYAGNFDLVLRYMVAKHGLQPGVDVKILEVPIATVIQALLAKKIDCGALPPLFSQMAEEQYGDRLAMLFDYYAVDIKKPGFNSMIILMTNDFVAKKREVAKTFIQAYLEAIKFANQDHGRASQIWAKEAGIPQVAKLKGFPYLPPDGKINLKGLEQTILLLNRFGYTKILPKAEDVVDQTLLDEVLGRPGG